MNYGTDGDHILTGSSGVLRARVRTRAWDRSAPELEAFDSMVFVHDLIKEGDLPPKVRHANCSDIGVGVALVCFARTRFLKGRLISKCRMKGLLVVDLRDEAVDAATGVVEVDEGLAVDLFGLERLHEAFGLGVVEKDCPAGSC